MMLSREHRERAKVLAHKYGYLPYMVERYLALWGEEETIRFLDACERPIRTSIRANTLKTQTETLVKKLKRKRVKLERVPWLDEGWWAEFGSLSPGALLEHMKGLYYVQGVPSMTVTRVLDPQPGDTVVDLAAAPGGKTTHAAQLMKNEGVLVSIELDRTRVASLESNISRCGVENCIVLRGDARKVASLGLRPNRVLLDAPCSGEGLLPLDPTRKTSKSMADIRYCAVREDEMLDAAVKILAPGGTLVYSTCSIAPEEGEYVVDGILRRNHGIKVDPIRIEFGSPAYTTPYGVEMDSSLALARRLLPHMHGTEGFFVCRITKEG